MSCFVIFNLDIFDGAIELDMGCDVSCFHTLMYPAHLFCLVYLWTQFFSMCAAHVLKLIEVDQ